MMYAIYSSDGSRKLTNLNEIITQGSNGVTTIFIAVEGYENNYYDATTYFKLPDGTINSLVGVASSQTFDDDTYAGWLFTITSAQTLYAGEVLASIRVVDNNSQVLFAFPLNLTINESTVDLNEVSLSLAQYQNLVLALNSKQDKFTSPNVRGYETYADANSDIDNLAEGQYIYVAQFDKFYYKYDSDLEQVYIEIALNDDGGILTSDQQEIINEALHTVVISHNNIKYYFSSVAGTTVVFKSLGVSVSTVNGKQKLTQSLLTINYSNGDYVFTNPEIDTYYNATQIDSMLGDFTQLYRFQGTKTVSQLNALSPTSSYNGFVYNVSDTGTLTQGNISVVAGDNVVVVWDSDNNTWSWDKFAGVDTTNFVTRDSTQTITGQKTFQNRVVIDGFGSNGMLDLFYSYVETNVKNYFARVGLTPTQMVTYKLPYDYADVGVANYTFEVAENKVTTLSNASTDTQYPSAKVVWDNLQDIREVAEGRCKTFVLSFSDSITSVKDDITDLGSKVYDINGNDITSAVANGDYDHLENDNEIDNGKFNSDSNEISCAYYLILRYGDQLLMQSTDYILANTSSMGAKVGDIFLVVETTVPDRWFGGDVVFQKLETTKINLNYLYAKNADLIPAYNNAYDIGSSSYNFKDLYLSGKIYLGNTTNFIQFSSIYYMTYFNAGAVFNGNISPNGSTQDLGSSADLWQDLYLSRDLTDGTNAYTITESYDLLYGKYIVYGASDNIFNLGYDKLYYFNSFGSDTTVTLVSPPTLCYPEYRMLVINIDSSSHTLTFPAGTKILTNDDNITISSNVATIPANASVEVSIVNGCCVIVNFEVTE